MVAEIFRFGRGSNGNLFRVIGTGHLSGDEPYKLDIKGRCPDLDRDFRTDYRIVSLARDGGLYSLASVKPGIRFMAIDPRAEWPSLAGLLNDLPIDDDLGLRDIDDAEVLAIINYAEENRPVVNLQGPVIINPETRTGEQYNLLDYFNEGEIRGYGCKVPLGSPLKVV